MYSKQIPKVGDKTMKIKFEIQDKFVKIIHAKKNTWKLVFKSLKWAEYFIGDPLIKVDLK